MAWAVAADGITLRVRATPRGGRDAVGGIGHDAAGVAHLKARVAAAPVDGGANAAVVALVAAWLGVPRRDVSLIAGDTARVKMLRISGPGDALAARCAALALPVAA